MDSYTQNLIDEYACRSLQEHYWRALSEQDVEGVVRVFTETGRWGSSKGHRAIREAAIELFKSLDVLEHMSTAVGSLSIRVEGDRATGAIEGIAHHVVRDGGQRRIVVANALYYLAWVREADGWRILSMTGRKDPDALHDAAFQYNVPMADIDYGLAAPRALD